jgi:uracil-DNA glycosylase
VVGEQQSLAFGQDPAPDSGNRLQFGSHDPAGWPVAPDWKSLVDHFLASSQGQALTGFLHDRLKAGACIYPARPFRALELTPLAQTRVVILGQDPYHGAGQAEGLAFSVPPGVAIPPSLRNIYKEIDRDPGLPSSLIKGARSSGSLERWARQGVLLLNTCLTVEASLPASHARQGWEVLTDDIVRAVAERDSVVVFLLWGAHAQAKRTLIAQSQCSGHHAIFCANHPSPLAASRPPVPFMGCGHFSLANRFLASHGLDPIDW